MARYPEGVVRVHGETAFPFLFLTVADDTMAARRVAASMPLSYTPM